MLKLSKLQQRFMKETEGKRVEVFCKGHVATPTFTGVVLAIHKEIKKNCKSSLIGVK